MPRNKAFSLPEVLVATALAAILAAFLAGAFKQATASSRTAKCLHKLRHLGVAAHLFIHEKGGTLPYTAGSPNWMLNLAPYLGLKASKASGNDPWTDVFLCPDDPARSPRQLRTYKYNQSFPSEAGAKEFGKSNYTPAKYLQIARPSTHAMLVCVAFIDNRQLEIWRFDNAIWKETSEALYPPSVPGAVFTRPHHRDRALNILYSDGHAAVTRYPLPPEIWHFDGR